MSRSYANENNTAWKLVLEKILEAPLSCGITITDDSIILFSSDINELTPIHNKFEVLCLCPSIIPSRLGYQLSSSTAEITPSEATLTLTSLDFDRPEAPTPSDTLPLIHRMFPVMEITPGISLDLSRVFQSAPTGDLATTLSKPIGSLDLTIWQQYLPQFISTIINIPATRLRSMYLGRPMDEATPSPDFYLSNKLFEKCLYFKVLTDGTHLVFDQGLFYSLLFPQPTTIVTASPDTTQNSDLHQLTINKKQLSLLLSQAIPEEILFEGTLTSDGTSSETYTPIILPSLFRSATDTKIYLMLDTTGSMEKVLPAYKRHVQQFVASLPPYFNSDHDTLFVIPFNKDELPSDLYNSPQSKAFYLKQQGQLSQCCEYIESLTCDHQTRLHGAVNDLLSRAAFNDAANENRVLVLITDGCNNIDDTTITAELASSQMKSYVMGLGDHYDEALCQHIATETNGRHIKLDSIENFSEIEQHLSEVVQARTLRKLFSQLISVYNDPILLANLSININEPFTLDGNEYILSEGAIHRVNVTTAPAIEYHNEEDALHDEDEPHQVANQTSTITHPISTMIATLTSQPTEYKAAITVAVLAIVLALYNNVGSFDSISSYGLFATNSDSLSIFEPNAILPKP
jgi:hypothetical protein